MKIGVARRGFSRSGGAESYLKRFAEAASAQGHECVLFSAEWPREEWPFGEMISLTAKSPRGFADSLTAIQPRKHCDFLFSLERVWKCDAYRAGDGVHRAWLERRAEFEPKWKSLFRGMQRKHRELLALETQLFTPQATPLVIANSDLVKREIVAHYDYPAAQIAIVPNGISPQVFAQIDPLARARIREKLGLSEVDYVVLFAGSGWERKGLRFAIEAINRVQNAKPTLIVAGRGKQARQPRSARTRFVGEVSPINDWLAAADAFLLPTIYDPFSNACLEALAAGLPVITSAANGFSEIIRAGEEGEIVGNPADVEALARAIEKWSDVKKREAIRPALASLTAKYGIEENVKSTLDLIHKASGRVGE